jgi:phosphate transport system permease protein
MIMDESMDSTGKGGTMSQRASVTFVRAKGSDLSAVGEPFIWGMGGALAFGVLMILGFLALVIINGLITFWPKPLEQVRLTDGRVFAGELVRVERYRPSPDQLLALNDEVKAKIRADGGFADRSLYRIGNYDFYNNDFQWISDYEVAERASPKDLVLIERQEWGVFVGRVAQVRAGDEIIDNPDMKALGAHFDEARGLRTERARVERNEIGEVNHEINNGRLRIRRAILDANGREDAPSVKAVMDKVAAEKGDLDRRFQEAGAKVAAIREKDAQFTVTLTEIGGQSKTLPLSSLVRYYQPNGLSLAGSLAIYAARWGEFIVDEPREANTEGGVMPAIFGTLVMTVVMSLIVAPFGVITALYLREYAKQGTVVSIVRISVNNLAGVPSIVYGVFGLGFFAYILGGNIDALFFPERLPNPTFGTGGVLWSALTLALLTVPVVIVATEEALAAVPRSMREGSLACGASKWQTIKWIVLPRAAPGIMTGLILAMARGAGEVAPLMLVGVVKLAPELPIDFTFPYVHLERSFMHLGFHIFDVAFQSRNSEAGRPMVYVTTLILIGVVLVLNIFAIQVRTRLKKRFQGSQF